MSRTIDTYTDQAAKRQRYSFDFDQHHIANLRKLVLDLAVGEDGADDYIAAIGALNMPRDGTEAVEIAQLKDAIDSLAKVQDFEGMMSAIRVLLHADSYFARAFVRVAVEGAAGDIGKLAAHLKVMMDAPDVTPEQLRKVIHALAQAEFAAGSEPARLTRGVLALAQDTNGAAVLSGELRRLNAAVHALQDGGDRPEQRMTSTSAASTIIAAAPITTPTATTAVAAAVDAATAAAAAGIDAPTAISAAAAIATPAAAAAAAATAIATVDAAAIDAAAIDASVSAAAANAVSAAAIDTAAIDVTTTTAAAANAVSAAAADTAAIDVTTTAAAAAANAVSATAIDTAATNANAANAVSDAAVDASVVTTTAIIVATPAAAGDGGGGDGGGGEDGGSEGGGEGEGGGGDSDGGGEGGSDGGGSEGGGAAAPATAAPPLPPSLPAAAKGRQQSPTTSPQITSWSSLRTS